MKKNKYPPGWDEERVQSIIDYYENQTEDEAVAEAEEAFRHEFITKIEVPTQLVSAVHELIAKQAVNDQEQWIGTETEKLRFSDAFDYSGFEKRVSSMKNRPYYKSDSLEVSFMFPKNYSKAHNYGDTGGEVRSLASGA